MQQVGQGTANLPGGGRAPVFVLQANTKRETGREAQLGNIQAAKAIADVIRTCLGPRAMLKLMLNPMGGIAITNDGNAILREIDVAHPAAKSMIELSRAQDENVGDGTTSVVILAGELLMVAAPYLERGIHPTVIIRAYSRALQDVVEAADRIAEKLDPNDDEKMLSLIAASIGTKFIARWSDQMCKLALDAVRIVHTVDEERNRSEIDLKRYVRVEKVPGGDLEDSRVIQGVMLNKDVTHSKMKRRMEKPRILLLDCTLEFKKGESATNIEVKEAADWSAILAEEEAAVASLVADIVKWKPDVVLTEKGISDLAQHYFVKAGITAFRRLRKTDNNRLARACGATICHRTDEISEKDIGTGCGLMEVRKIGDEYYVFFEECEAPKACTVLLRGASKDVLSEVDRNLQDAMNVARNVLMDPKLLPGGGATEMALSQALQQKSKSIEGVEQWPYKAVAAALEIIPRTLAENCGANAVRVLTALRAKHAVGGEKAANWGINGVSGELQEMQELLMEPFEVKMQTIKTAVESAQLLLRVDDIVSGSKPQGQGNPAEMTEEQMMAQ